MFTWNDEERFARLAADRDQLQERYNAGLEVITEYRQELDAMRADRDRQHVRAVEAERLAAGRWQTVQALNERRQELRAELAAVRESFARNLRQVNEQLHEMTRQRDAAQGNATQARKSLERAQSVRHPIPSPELYQQLEQLRAEKERMGADLASAIEAQVTCTETWRALAVDLACVLEECRGACRGCLSYECPGCEGDR